MAQDQETTKQSSALKKLSRLASLSIRGKIVLPYLILTLIVAIVGTYVVTTLVSSSLSERLTNQLVEAGTVISDSLALQELDHIEAARAAAFTVGLAEAIQSGNREQVTTLAQPIAAVQGVECLIVANTQGQTMLHVLRRADGTTDVLEEPFDLSDLWMVQALVASGDPNALPERGLVLHRLEQRYYYFTAIPVGLEGDVVGVIVVGTSLDTLLAQFKQASLADVIVYGEGGQALDTTFILREQSAEGEENTSLDALSIAPETYANLLLAAGVTHFENTDDIAGRSYRIARGPLRVGNDSIGVFAVVLPSTFITERGSTSRDTYALVFAVATAAVIVVGFLISQRITTPIRRLVNTSQAVAEGNLEQRTGITSTDEIGFLAETFDEMTVRLADRSRALEETLGRLQAILSSIGDGVILDTDNRLIPLNTAAEAMLQDLSDNFLLGPLHEVSMGGLTESAITQTNPWLDRRRIEVGKKVVTAHSAAVQTKAGEPLGTVVVLRDVTAEAEAEQVKDAFVAHVSHELRTPLTAVKGYSELLLVGAIGPLEEEQRHFLRTIHHHTESLVTMINALLDFSELEAWDRLSLQRYPVQLSELVEETAQDWRAQMAEKNLAFEVEAPTDVPTVNADPKRLQWVIVNLVRNAWQYTPEGGSVSVRLYTQDSNVVLDVQDTGIGISREDQQKLFTRFHRVRQTTDETRGIGLGLYVSKAIVEAHGGDILVSSEVGTGSTFSIILPALQGEGSAVLNTAEGGLQNGG